MFSKIEHTIFQNVQIPDFHFFEMSYFQKFIYSKKLKLSQYSRRDQQKENCHMMNGIAQICVKERRRILRML